MASIGFYSALFQQNNLYFDFTENNLQSLSNHYYSYAIMESSTILLQAF